MADKTQRDRERYTRLRDARRAALPPDLITLLTPEQRAYLAGLIDGEGSIYVAAVGPARDRTCYPIVVVAMTHRGVIEYVRELIDAPKVQRHNATAMRRAPHLRPQYRVQVTGKRAALLCDALLPYLRVKEEQARLVTMFPTDARIAPGVKIERSAVNAERYRLRGVINGLNASGSLA